MPVVESTYNPPKLFKNGFFSTLYSATLRKVSSTNLERERITLPDDDFLDIDWSKTPENKGKLLISLHGLEGDAQRPYMLGICKLFNEKNWDVASVNFRGCSGEINNLYRSYTGGATEDLIAIVNHVLEKKCYTKIALSGISLGGNLLLKYLGEGNKLPKELIGGVAVSSPLDLYASLIEINSKPNNKLYDIYFRKYFYDKLKKKHKKFPDKINIKEFNLFTPLKDVDEKYTAPAHGFKNAMEYYKKCSSLQFLPYIKTPTLIINAKNDSFLSRKCYPYKAAEENDFLFLEVPEYGGHVGFYQENNVYYNEKRALEFLENLIA
ncbi:MAG: YheT family hydrolase [Flavobacteriales bacterium]